MIAGYKLKIYFKLFILFNVNSIDMDCGGECFVERVE